MGTDNVVLVNEKGEQIGLMEKIEAHEKALLHLAFSVFVFNEKDELMIQQLEKEGFRKKWALVPS